ncbi:hypothetical protein CCP3SC15_1690007 [Gammaproteobacteria bacterium]
MDKGLSFALDDFGTGYSSLTYFRKLPISTLKIDQTFVRDMLDDPEDLEIVESVVGLAQAFNRPVIAEGVESMEHWAMLLRLGCQFGQGYVITRPIPPEHLPEWVTYWQEEHLWRDLGTSSSVREDIALFVAAISHRQWIRQVVEYLQKYPAEHLLPPLSTHHCRFGGWYHHNGAARYHHLTEFQALEPLHERVHALAAELLALAKDGRREEALARLPDLLLLRDDFLANLERLTVQVKNESKELQNSASHESYLFPRDVNPLESDESS